MNYQKYLTENVLPFWLKHGIDKEKGGIFLNLNREGKADFTEKNIWFTGRALWSFATAYNVIDQKQEYLDTCAGLYAFIKKSVMPNGRLPFLTDRDANATEAKALFHGEAYVAMGCAAYYRASKDEAVKQSAINFFNTVYSLYKTGDGRIENCKGNQRFVFGRDMFALSVAQAMRSAGIKNEKVEVLADYAIKNIFTTGYINDELKLVNEYVGCNGAAYDLSCIGHLYEAAWFILYEGETKKDKEITDLGKKILDYSLTREKNKSIEAVRLLSTSDYNEYVWWPQCEAIIAYYLAYHIFKDDFYLQCAKRIEAFAFENFADKENCEWFEKCAKGGKVTSDVKGSAVKGAFHLPRMLMVLDYLNKHGTLEGF